LLRHDKDDIRIFTLIIVQLAFGLALPLQGQNFTRVTGTITDGLDWSNESVQAQITPHGGVSPTIEGQGVGGYAGTFNTMLASNAAIVPVGTQWAFTVCIAAGVSLTIGTSPHCLSTAQVISEATMKFSTTLTPLSPVFSNVAAGPAGLKAPPLLPTPAQLELMRYTDGKRCGFG